MYPQLNVIRTVRPQMVTHIPGDREMHTCNYLMCGYGGVAFHAHTAMTKTDMVCGGYVMRCGGYVMRWICDEVCGGYVMRCGVGM